MTELRENTTAVVARNELWQGHAATEPYEAGWANEAIVFVRALAIAGQHPPALAHVQVSPDGMHWANEGTTFHLPAEADAVTFAKVRHFGNWLRIVAEVPSAAQLQVLVAIHLKA